jgi:hypothetical protein
VTFATPVSRPPWRWSEAWRAALPPWLLARVLVPGALLVSRHLADELGVVPRPRELDAGLFSWDASFYADIARHGYDSVGDAGLRFFPLYPLLGRALALVPGVGTKAALLVVANAAALVAGLLLHALATREHDDADLARRGAWFLALAPPAFVLVMGYAEALFLALSIGVFYALRTERWWWAAGLGVLAGMTRPVGVLLVTAALVEVARGMSRATTRHKVARVAALVGPGAGLFAYLSWVDDRTHDFWAVFRVYDDPQLRGDTVSPVSSLADAFGALGDGDRLGTGLHFLTAIGLLLLLVVLARSWPASYTVYAGTTLLVLLTGSTLNSLERYALACFPFVLAAATVFRRPVAERAALVVSSAALFALAVLAFAGVHVP